MVWVRRGEQRPYSRAVLGVVGKGSPSQPRPGQHFLSPCSLDLTSFSQPCGCHRRYFTDEWTEAHGIN